MLHGPVLVLLFALPTYAAELKGHVVSVTDGDTITVLDANKTEHKVRLAGIDAPETRQPYGQASRKHLAGLVAGRAVRVEWDKRDRYGRIVGKVYRNGKDECLAQLEAGMAWHFKRYQHEQTEADRKTYSKAEERARLERIGLWHEREPVPPWEWRDR